MQQITPDPLSKKLKIASFLSIIMVVASHANCSPKYLKHATPQVSAHYAIQDFISGGICQISVPIFFVISGFLFFKSKPFTAETYKKQLRRRITTLVIPYIIWNTLVFAQLTLAKKAAFAHQAPDSPVELLYQIYIAPAAGPFWFIRDLLKVMLLSPLLHFLHSKANALTLATLCLLYLLQISPPLIPITAILFFFIGLTLANSTIKRPPLTTSYIIATLWPALVAASQLTPDSNIFSKVSRGLSIITGCYAFWFLLDTTPIQSATKKIPEWALGATFFIFAFHEPNLIIIKKLALSINPQSPAFSTAVYIAAPALITAITIALNSISKKKTPNLHSLLTGAR